jgi:large subunit ribosomal protein L32
MAVPQNRKSSSKRGMHRSHDHLVGPTLSIEPHTGEVHRRHHISRDGYYRGRAILTSHKNKDE